MNKGGASYSVVADTVSNLLEDERFPNQEIDSVLKQETHPAYQTLRGKRPYTKSRATNTSAVGWKIKAVDDPKYFDRLSSRSIVVDASNRPHIAYGGDHLYYAYHDGSKWNYQTVDASLLVGDYASIALDTSVIMMLLMEPSNMPESVR